MAVKVAHVMAERAILAKPNHTIHHVREVLACSYIHAVPVVGPNRIVRGIVSTADLARR